MEKKIFLSGFIYWLDSWAGNTLGQIAGEKAGIFKVCGSDIC